MVKGKKLKTVKEEFIFYSTHALILVSFMFLIQSIFWEILKISWVRDLGVLILYLTFSMVLFFNNLTQLFAHLTISHKINILSWFIISMSYLYLLVKIVQSGVPIF